MGAHTQKKGRFELASGGTIFLDEIGDLSLTTQNKLLRVLRAAKVDHLGLLPDTFRVIFYPEKGQQDWTCVKP